MSAPLRLVGYAAALVALFGGAVATGAAIGPDRGGDDEPTAAGGHGHATPHGDAAASASGGGRHERAPGGLAIAERGLRLDVATPALRAGVREPLAFRIVRDDGTVVRRFDVEHERRMHLILVRRDLTGFQHLHPELDADGTWRTTTTVAEPGSYRLFADFSHAGEPFTLGADVRVAGHGALRALPAPATVATSDGGDRVTLGARHGHGAATPHAGAPTTLRFAVERDGRPVALEPYLGAAGHLVALREGDLGFLHVHPEGDELAFATAFPTPGRYRLFLQYRSGGRVQTAAFTVAVTR